MIYSLPIFVFYGASKSMYNNINIKFTIQLIPFRK
jgi:hypothetical protein